MINEKKLRNLIKNFKAYDNRETLQIILKYTKIKNNINNFRNDKTVYVIVGPSGSGKSTLIANLYESNFFGNTENNFVPIINRFYTDTKLTLEKEIELKTELLQSGKSFLIESANFDKAYSDFIKFIKLKYDYNICLLYLTKNHPKENVSMVLKRKNEGGHGKKSLELNEEAIKQMYITDSQNLVEVMPYCDVCFVIKNTTAKNSDIVTPTILLHKQQDGNIKYNHSWVSAFFLYHNILKENKTDLFDIKDIKIKSLKKYKLFKKSEQQTKQVYSSTQKLEHKIESVLERVKNFSIEKEREELKRKEIEKILEGKILEKK